jgi:hypothetical protein
MFEKTGSAEALIEAAQEWPSDVLKIERSLEVMHGSQFAAVIFPASLPYGCMLFSIEGLRALGWTIPKVDG